MNISNVLNCSFSSWYNEFRKITIKSQIIPLPQEFVDYLLADGIVLPPGSFTEATYDRSSDNDCSSDEDDWESSDESEAKAPSFPELEEEIKSCIEDLGGTVFPKLNWSSPKDAKWITASHTLQCGSLGEVILLLKSSDFITHDLISPFKNCDDWHPNKNESPPSNGITYELIMRKWVDINPGTEFRCFVRDDSLIAICQRDHTNFYDFIVSNKLQLLLDIVSFFKEKVRGKFADTDYVFDIYQASKDCIKLIDFNVFGVTTDPLLFDWDDLVNMRITAGKLPEFRCVTSYNGIQPNPYRYYAMPVDFLDLSTGQDSYKMIDFLQLMNINKAAPEETSSSSSDEDAHHDPTLDPDIDSQCTV